MIFGERKERGSGREGEGKVDGIVSDFFVERERGIEL